MADRPTGTVTFLFTDIEGSTPLWDSYPEAMGEALARHDEILRSAIDAWRGHVFSTTGDGLAAVFSRADSAVAAGLEAQRSFRREPWPEGIPLLVRMGAHTGEVQERGGNYFGPPVNRAARLMGASNGGQLVVSALTAELLDGSADIELVDLGSVQLKGVVEPVHVFGVSADGVDWLDRPLVATQTTAGNLPRLQTEGVGDLANLQSRVSRLALARLVTLTGSGGVGKTRAAIEIGWLVVDEFPDGVWFVELGPIADPEAVIGAVASSLSIQPEAGVSVIESIVDWCLGRRMLLIVDNCEHLLEPVIELVSSVMAGCPTVTIAATSREPLGVAGEHVERIPSLGLDDGVELFITRARSADASFTPSPNDSEAIGAICTRLDGIPLAIELAAARIRSLTPAELLDRLDDRFRLLRGGGRGGLERHQTLRAAVTWSYRLLSDIDRLLFDRLSVFAGGFDAKAAEEVCSGNAIDDDEVIDVIGELVDKSMVIATRGEQGTRYRLLETLRQFGEERLDDRSETARLRDRHLNYYERLAVAARERLFSPDEIEANALLDEEWDNIRAAHGWATTIADLTRSQSLIDATAHHAVERPRHEHAEWTQRTLALGEAHGGCASSTYLVAAQWAFQAADLDRMIEISRRGIDLDPGGSCRATLVRGLVANGQLDKATAELPDLLDAMSNDPDPEFEFHAHMALANAHAGKPSSDEVLSRFLEFADRIGAPTIRATAKRMHAITRIFSRKHRDPAAAADEFREAAALAEVAGSVTTACWVRMGLAGALLFGGHRDGLPTLREALSGSYDARQWLIVRLNLESAANLLSYAGGAESAATVLGYIEQYPPGFYAGRWARARTVESVSHFPAAAKHRAIGANMDRHQIVGYALAALDDLEPHT